MNNISPTSHVSIPYLMRKYKLTYKKAREIMEFWNSEEEIDRRLSLPEWCEKYVKREEEIIMKD